MVLHFALNNTKVCTIAKKTRVTTVKDTQTDLNILVMRLAERAGYQCSTVTQSCLVLLWRKENCCPYASNITCHSEWLKKRATIKENLYDYESMVQIKVAETRPNVTLGSESCQKRRKGSHYSLCAIVGGAFYSNQT